MLCALQLQELESSSRNASTQHAEDVLTLQKENEQLKEVLSAVQVDLETKTEVGKWLHGA
jgi:hypothetical protein